MAGHNRIAEQQAAIQGLWRALDAAVESGAPGAVLPPLRALYAGRQRLGDIPDVGAEALAAALRILEPTNSQEAAAEGWPLALDLLARWCASPAAARRAGAGGTGAGAAAAAAAAAWGALEAARAEVLRALESGSCPPAAAGPAMGFLGAALASGEGAGVARAQSLFESPFELRSGIRIAIRGTPWGPALGRPLGSAAYQAACRRGALDGRPPGLQTTHPHIPCPRPAPLALAPQPRRSRAALILHSPPRPPLCEASGRGCWSRLCFRACSRAPGCWRKQTLWRPAAWMATAAAAGGCWAR